jgi:hypothetical protein
MKRSWLVVFVLLVLPGCAREDAGPPVERLGPPDPELATEPVAAAASAPVIATGESELSGIRAEIHELRRVTGDLTLQFSIVNESQQNLDFGYTFVDPSHNIADFGGIGGVYLIDGAAGERLPVTRGPDGRCICSRKVRAIAPGQRAQLWAKFPEPSVEVERVSIMIPRFMPIDDVPIATAPDVATAEPVEPGDVLAVAQGEIPGRRVEIRQLRRGPGAVVDLRFTIVNDGDATLSFGYDYAHPDHEVTDFGSVGGVYLLDLHNRELYGVLRDSENRCACSRDVSGIGTGERAELWAKFPAPAETTHRLSVVVPHFMPADDVPLE